MALNDTVLEAGFRRVMRGGVLAMALVLLATVAGPPAQAAERLQIHKYNGVLPTASELARLPRYCWGWFTNYKGPRYFIPKSQCGPGMNHYCGGLVKKMRAESIVTPPKVRFRLYKSALKDFNYTLNWMKNYPACPLRKQATANKLAATVRIQGLAASLGR